MSTAPFSRAGRFLAHIFYLVRASLWLALAFSRAAWFFRFRAYDILDLPPGAALQSKEKRRLQHYFYGTSYLSVIFCALRGRIRTPPEKKLFTRLAALAYFFDDLVDRYRNADDRQTLWENNPEVYGSKADDSGLALHFLQQIYGELPEKDLPMFKDFMHRVFNTETAGRQNQSEAPSPAVLAQVTAEKGGYSALLFRRVLAHPLDAAEQNAIYQFGYLIQLCDDIYDLWFDCGDGTATIASHFARKNDLQSLHAAFENQVSATVRAFRACSYPTTQIETALRVIHYIVALTRVCLQQYEKLLKKRGTLPLSNRSEMVVDMERNGNRLRAARALLGDLERRQM